MTTKLLIAILLCLCVTVKGLAQPESVPPDLPAIQKAVSAPASALYYPKLLTRYRAGDSTLTLEERRALYYGHAFQPGYSAYGGSDYADSVRSLVQKDSLTTPDFLKLLTFTDSVLRTDPFDMRMLKYREYATKKTNNKRLHDIAYAQVDVIIGAILSTGDGRSTKTALWVTSVSHEYEMLPVLGYQYGGSQSLVEGPCDYLTLQKNDDNLAGMYFNVSIGFAQLESEFKDTKKGKSKKK